MSAHELDEEIEAAADAKAQDPTDETPDAADGSRTIRGYDKRLVYGIGGAVVAVFIGFSFMGGSPERPNPSTTAVPAVDDGPLIADPPYAAARRDPPLVPSDSQSASLVPPPSSAVIGGADGKAYSAVGSGAVPAAAETGDATPVPPDASVAGAEGTPPASEDPRRVAWRAVRDASPTSVWARVGSSSTGSSLSEPVQQWDPDSSRPAAEEASADSAAADDAVAADGSNQLDPAVSNTFVVPALTRIEAALVTAVNSDVPGDVVAQVIRDVPDVSGEHVAIPAGSLLLGKQTDQVAVGQRRVVVAWSLLQLPDRSSVPLPGLPAADERGAAGLPGSVSSPAAGAFGRALLLSAIGAGVQLSQPQSREGAAPSAGSVAAAAVGQQLAELSTQLLRRDVNVRPTIRRAEGSYLTVLVVRDLPVPARQWGRAAPRR